MCVHVLAQIPEVVAQEFAAVRRVEEEEEEGGGAALTNTYQGGKLNLMWYVVDTHGTG